MANPPGCGCDFKMSPMIPGVTIVKSVNGEDANVAPGPLVAVRKYCDLDLSGPATTSQPATVE